MKRSWPEGEGVLLWGAADRPEGFQYHGQDHRILEICNRWQIHARWWEPGETVWREYLKVLTDTGLLCLIHHDLLSDEWVITQIYD